MRLIALLALLLPLSACVDVVDVEADSAAVAVAGPWAIPAQTLAIGDTQYVAYTGAGPWVGTDGCSGSLLPGTAALRDWIYANLPQVWYVGGYSCRAINGDSTTMSVHGTGRALDLHIELDDGAADNTLGDPVGNYLIEHAQELGMQYIIWDLWKWNASRSAGSKDGAYGGAHPHHDHLHIELSPEAATMELPWYQGPMNPPDFTPCGEIPAAGGIIDDGDLCAQRFGPTTYWREVGDAGYGGGLVWTNAFESDEPSNWARFNLFMVAAGDYRVEYYSTPEYAIYDSVRYEIVHDGDTSVVAVDQAGLSGWVGLGTFTFAAGGQQSINVYDDSATPIPADQSIVIDAIRLTPIGVDPDPDPDPNPDPDPDPDTDTDTDPDTDTDTDDPDGSDTSPGDSGDDQANWGLQGGCNTSGPPASSPLFMLLCGFLWRRLRRA